MSTSKEQQPQHKREEAIVSEKELPSESSPYVQYSNLEDYKQNAYGTQGHLSVADNQRGTGATDAPTISGNGLSEGQVARSSIDCLFSFSSLSSSSLTFEQ
ncbi:uncharacterized protein A4U43_C07F27690 [Asparagus officinalis]|uniref:Uncharacterized protein n=1 Tax=Asparagus officinalis TaxID=4686 RepID=A0A5P1EJ12_ASPOF|nr:uncharacterized protein A4U43_C07F27690 [Asparagus officinalis]